MDYIQGINWLAVLGAAVAAFLLGGLWFSPVMFANKFMEAIAKKPEELGKPAPAMTLSFVTTLIMATSLALIVSKMTYITVLGGLRLGLAIGVGVVLMGMISDSAFTATSKQLLWIQGSYHVAMVVLMTVILAAWA